MLKRRINRIILASIILSLGLCLPRAQSRGVLATCFAKEKIIAVVNNDVITQRDLDDFGNYMKMQLASQYRGKQLEDRLRQMQSELLDRLVEDRIILQEAKRNNIVIDENRIKAKINEIRSHYPSEIEFQRALDKQGMVQADMEKRIREQMLMYVIVESKVRSKIIVSPNEVTDYYQKNPQDFQSQQIYNFDNLIIEDESRANEIVKALKEKQDINGLAKKYSLELNKMEVRQGQLMRDIEDIILKMSLNEISAPIRVENKFYIFKLNSIIPPKQESLAQAQDKIYAFLLNKKMQVQLTKWLDELKKQSYIKIVSN